MSGKKLGLLAVVLIVFGIATFLTTKEPAPQGASSDSASGGLVFTDLDVNAIRHIEIRSPDTTNTLAREDEVWKVKSLFGYPANYETLRRELVTLAQMEVGEVRRGGGDLEDEFGVGDNTTQVEFYDGEGTVLAGLNIGTNRTSQGRGGGQFGGGFSGGFSDGQFIQLGDGPIIVVSDSLSGWTGNADTWINKKLLEIKGDDIHTVTVTHPDTEPVTVSFAGESTGTIAGLTENESVNAGNAGRLRRALNYLNCKSVVDSSISDEDSGISQATLYRAHAEDGITYIVRVGAEEDGARYARFSFAFQEPNGPTRDEAEAAVPPDAPEPVPEETGEGENPEPAPPPPSREERVETKYQELLDTHSNKVEEAKSRVEKLGKSLSPWIYTLSSYNAGSMILKRDELVTVKEEEEEEEDNQ